MQVRGRGLRAVTAALRKTWRENIQKVKKKTKQRQTEQSETNRKCGEEDVARLPKHRGEIVAFSFDYWGRFVASSFRGAAVLVRV